MITGTITADLEPLVHDVFARLRDGTNTPVRTILDTGFTGSFCLPRKILDQMTLKPATNEIYELADGSMVEEETSFGEIIIDNQPVVVRLIGTDSETALMGMAMLLEKEAIFNLKEMTIIVI
jgi:predicted aspartyl protease